MKNIIAFVFLTLTSTVSVASSSAECRALIDKIVDIADLKIALHCQHNLILGVSNATNQHKQTKGAINNQATTPAESQQPQVKKSKSNICHNKGSKYYSQTRKFTAFNSIQACLDSGGRLPRG